MAKKYPVIAEMIDSRTDTRVPAGATFESDDEEQIARLTKAGCLGEPSKPQQQSFDYERDKLKDLPLDGATPAALLAIAKHEGAELVKGDKTSAADLTKAIVAKRAEVAPDYDRDGLSNLDLAKATTLQLQAIGTREGADVTVATADDAALRTAIETKRAG